MRSLIIKLAELGFTAHGCYRNGECEKCHVETTAWFWRGKWLCDNCVFDAIVVVDPRTRTDGGDPIPAGTFLLLHARVH
jgi:hypothetical protein